MRTGAPLLALALTSFSTALAVQGTPGAAGDLYVTSYFTNEVLQFDVTTGAFVGAFATGGGMNRPRAVEFGPNGNLFVASQNTDSIIEFDGTTGAVVGTFASSGIDDPHALRFMPGGNLLVSNGLGQATITEHDGATGALLQTFADGGVDGFSFVQGMHFRSNGNLLITDQIGHRVFEYDGTGTFLGTLAGLSSGLSTPLGLDLAANGNLFVANHGTDRVLELDGATGDLLSIFAIGPELVTPHDVEIGSNGNLFVSSGLNWVVEYDGATGAFIRTLAGGGMNLPIGLTFKPGTGVGTSYCSPAVPNSTGLPGVINASGSPVVSVNDLTLTATQLPVNFGYFLVSQDQGQFNPPGSDGVLCLSGSIGRYNQPQNIIQGPTGSILLDLTSVPVSPPQAAQPGETWNFQCWFRDNNPTLTSNFTDAVSVVFQ